MQASDQNLGHLEVQAAHDVQELLRQAVERGAQTKAAATPPTCPVCGHKLTRRSGDHARTFACRYGAITIARTRGYCKRCRKWRTPADAALGLEESAGYSPTVQDMAALLASKMPVEDASAVLEHLTGIQLPRATLAREAKRQGERAQARRTRLDQQAATGKRPMELALEPYQMIIQLDAWNIRERDGWGQTAEQRRAGHKLKRWPQARQRLDFYHAAQHLVAVGRALHGEDKAKLTAWLKPLGQQLKHESSVKVIGQLEEALAALPGGASATAVTKEVEYFREHQGRMDYRAGRRAGEPIGSGPVEATRRQDQCRFKRPGQFWSRSGDESLLCLETFWRNGRWSLIFPLSAFNPARN